MDEDRFLLKTSKQMRHLPCSMLMDVSILTLYFSWNYLNRLMIVFRRVEKIYDFYLKMKKQI